MNPSSGADRRWFGAVVLLSSCLTGLTGLTAPATAVSAPEHYNQLVERFRALEAREASFGPDYEPLYRAAIAWYEAWGNHTNDPADTSLSRPMNMRQSSPTRWSTATITSVSTWAAPSRWPLRRNCPTGQSSKQIIN